MCGRCELDLTEVWDERRSGTVNPVVSITSHSSSRVGCLGFLPGDAERFLEESANMGQQILWATLAPRERIAARAVTTALRALVGGKAMSCIRHHP